MPHLVQLSHPGRGRRVALVEQESLRLLAAPSIYALVEQALACGTLLSRLALDSATDETLPYEPIYQGESDWRLLPAIDHPEQPALCLISGTGLTHRASAAQRQAMHALDDKPTDSMRMYQWGMEAGRPVGEQPGVAPEWFYKGTGYSLRAHNESLVAPAFAADAGEEAEIAGVYYVGAGGVPYRVGLVQGNEFSDHVLEKRNYLYLAASKLLPAAIGPELALDAAFDSVRGQARILRNGETLWQKEIHTGQAHMCHSLENIEHHHFKFPQHRLPGSVHVHFLGAAAFSFGDGVKLEPGDVMEVAFEGFGRPLRNRLEVASEPAALVHVRAL